MHAIWLLKIVKDFDKESIVIKIQKIFVNEHDIWLWGWRLSIKFFLVDFGFFVNK